MSVPLTKRGEGVYDVIVNADDIFVEIVKLSRKAPKDYFRLIYEPLINLSNELSIQLSKGNAIKITQNTILEDFMIRHTYYTKAKLTLEALEKRTSLIVARPFCLRYYDNKLKHTKGITEKELVAFASLINKEKHLLFGAIKSDMERILKYDPNWKDKIKNYDASNLNLD